MNKAAFNSGGEGDLRTVHVTFRAKTSSEANYHVHISYNETDQWRFCWGFLSVPL